MAGWPSEDQYIWLINIYIFLGLSHSGNWGPLEKILMVLGFSWFLKHSFLGITESISGIDLVAPISTSLVLVPLGFDTVGRRASESSVSHVKIQI